MLSVSPHAPRESTNRCGAALGRHYFYNIELHCNSLNKNISQDFYNIECVVIYYIVAEVISRYFKNNRGIKRTKLSEFRACLVVP